jgi:hypothetical protein
MSDRNFTPMTPNLLVRKGEAAPSSVVLAFVPPDSVSRARGPDMQMMQEGQFGSGTREYGFLMRSATVEEAYQRSRATSTAAEYSASGGAEAAIAPLRRIPPKNVAGATATPIALKRLLTACGTGLCTKRLTQ